eukprot:TRINITY_DN662_c1_g6_i1.p1 TRINITY_DN662_c1_g6~~TRINITY_DN662_c1_g6_i1.p1  ORF type:complete len:406 (-),score=88.71 TRINITY_DN662_c1_g6_i1:619-1836(-)
MNLELLDPFGQDFPEVIEDWLVSKSAVNCVFNKRGTLLAVGCNDGEVIIWDFDTRGIAKQWKAHIGTVTSVSWSRNGRKLLTSSADWALRLWDVLNVTEDITVRFESMVLSSQIHPKNKLMALACMYTAETPFLVDLTTGTKTPIVVDPTPSPNKVSSKTPSSKSVLTATWNKAGDKIFVGSSKGVISIVDLATLEVVHTIKIPGGSVVKSIQFSRDGKHFLVNSNDKVLRVYNASDYTFDRDFQDVVERWQWKEGCFSANGDYVIGGSAQNAEHKIYVWNRAFGHLERVLEGPKEGIMDLCWHPMRAIIASCSTSGNVYIWATNYTENWSAFAPDFRELEENIEYVEREDEFDYVEEATVKRQKEREEEEHVDIMTVEPIWSSDDEADELFFLPTVPDTDVVEQ